MRVSGAARYSVQGRRCLENVHTHSTTDPGPQTAGCAGSHVRLPVVLAVGVLVCQQTSQESYASDEQVGCCLSRGSEKRSFLHLGSYTLPAFGRTTRKKRLPWVLSGALFYQLHTS